VTSLHILFYHPGRGEEAKPAFESSFSQRSRKGNYFAFNAGTVLKILTFSPMKIILYT